MDRLLLAVLGGLTTYRTNAGGRAGNVRGGVLPEVLVTAPNLKVEARARELYCRDRSLAVLSLLFETKLTVSRPRLHRLGAARPDEPQLVAVGHEGVGSSD